MGDVQRHRRRMVFQLFAKAVCEPREAPRSHADRKVGALGVAGRNLSRNTDYRFAAYCYYRSRRIAVRRILPKIGDGIGLNDDAVSTRVPNASRMALR